ncbi:MAG: histidine kinase [Selenomonadaceae bacterium]|nr:histidine kinase [Selenomonadaceae bacterium]MBQ9496815.1 histidine kinase [Selenomonadaceae bacterium]
MKIVWNMRFKMFLAALVINVLGIIFAMLLFYHYAAEHFYSEYAASLQERVFIGAKNADAAFQKIYRATLDISFDAQVSELINRGDFATLATRLRNYREKNSLADDIYIFLPDKKILIRSEEYNSVQTLNETTAAAWKKIIDGQSGMRPIFAENILSPAAKKIFLYKAKVQGADAFVTTQISERGFYYNFIDDLGAGDSNIALMSDAAGNIVSQSRAYSNLNGNDFIRAEVEMPLSHYSIQLLVSKKKIHGKITFMQILSVLGVIFILLLSTFLLYMLAAKLNEPVENLAQVMQDVGHGNFSLRATVDGNDEIAYLAERFNHMLDNLENEKFLKRRAELHALQYQIRPHFIYNTLNSIRFAAMIQGAKNIGELLANFIELLQVSTNREGEFGTLAEEISTLKKYIALQEFRLMNSFAVDFNLAEETLSCRVPRLILQPFVENSILHAPSPEKTFCRIVIASELRGDELIITVTDDGKGMSPEVLENLSAKPRDEKTHGGFSGIGVSNIRERLRLYYGDAGKVICESDGRSFTKISIVLPAEVIP